MKSTEGAGKMATVTSVQRINTKGGVAPVAGCAPVDIGKTLKQGYAADYVFFVNA